ncbi:MAG: 50S ribosomal protein L7 [Clostridia bacterium]|nr:50S ribosomal protein L7 [Clostridia bacterium]
MHNILTLIGLCKRAGMLEVGEEPVEAVARAKDARVLLLAADAADNTARRVRHFAEMGNCLWLRVPFTKEEMGRSLGRTSCAIVAVTDIGFACNIVGRLAQEDPVRYDEAHAALQVKARRAAERKAEMLAHKKNIRTGKVRRKEAPPETPAQPQSQRQSAAADRRPPRDDRPRDRKPLGDHGSRKSAGTKRPSKANRPAPRAENRFAGSRPVKKGKGSFRKNG